MLMLINFNHFTLYGYQHITVYPINAYNYEGQSALLHGNLQFKRTSKLRMTVFSLASSSYLGDNTNKWTLIPWM